jgi:3-methyladenine DNA glycosylase Tag
MSYSAYIATKQHKENIMSNKAIIKAQQLLNIVSQDSTVCASLLTEDTGFYDLLCNVVTDATQTDESAYNTLMSYINENF